MNAAPGAERAVDAVERARRLFAAPCRFIAGAAGPDSLPPETHPEIAFAGRSNVGKSSLINALVGQTRLARVSRTPGRTREINFFDLGGRLCLADLPGYGFAAASRTKTESWTRLTEHYLAERASLRRLCILIDARHGLKPADRTLMGLLDRLGLAYQIVLTKSDKTPAPELARRIAEIAAEIALRPAALAEIIATSARAGAGIAALRTALAALADESGLG